MTDMLQRCFVAFLTFLWTLAICCQPGYAASTLAIISPGATPPPHNFVSDALKHMGSAVVRIDTERRIARPALDPRLNDPFLREFLGLDGFPNVPREDLVRGQGSGFIIDESGIILTNAHVVNGADTVSVTLKDGRIFEGEVRGVDDVSDLAVVKVVPGRDPLPTADLGDSDQIQVGDWAIAVGNPVGLDNTVTLGIVSTLHRSSAEIGIPDKRLEFIQTDAAINPGNSGGPLLNEQGQVIGINTAIRADAMGIGFAIPINKAKSLKDRLVRGEKILHPYIGLQMANLTPKLARQNNQDPNSPMILPEVEGVLVMKVMQGTPAERAGIRSGDVIVAVDNQEIQTADQMQKLVEQSQVGQRLTLSLRRGDRSQSVTVRTGELSDAV
ncbi:HhoA/HhoB/HtrA family serine endopeptidase [Lyngbya confervoides]|uniref:Trypsin-like peptidase domain-containing protein n=1 Tax=Lyngbya confervoides BDU141951 TaxID=1574623 RepID=A0ABD4SZ85_9CYAN|nr:HhoA/HhoB/HtrA family serine endopeptidase [Lyngbya confervoides]MCM1981461.1 trypsin-like peptidase domain-containing protein [Lyngbya confervoides BDU141951]